MADMNEITALTQALSLAAAGGAASDTGPEPGRALWRAVGDRVRQAKPQGEAILDSYAHHSAALRAKLMRLLEDVRATDDTQIQRLTDQVLNEDTVARTADRQANKADWLTGRLWSVLLWLEKFIDEHFKGMHSGVQAATFLVFVLLVVFLVLFLASLVTATPYIEGQIWVKTPNSPAKHGKFFVVNYAGGEVVANQFGRWAIRANRKMPGKILILIEDSDKRELGTVPVPIPIPLWSAFVIPDPVNIVYDQGSGHFRLGPPPSS